MVYLIRLEMPIRRLSIVAGGAAWPDESGCIRQTVTAELKIFFQLFPFSGSISVRTD